MCGAAATAGRTFALHPAATMLVRQMTRGPVVQCGEGMGEVLWGRGRSRALVLTNLRQSKPDQVRRVCSQPLPGSGAVAPPVLADSSGSAEWGSDASRTSPNRRDVASPGLRVEVGAVEGAPAAHCHQDVGFGVLEALTNCEYSDGGGPVAGGGSTSIRSVATFGDERHLNALVGEVI